MSSSYQIIETQLKIDVSERPEIEEMSHCYLLQLVYPWNPTFSAEKQVKDSTWTRTNGNAIWRVVEEAKLLHCTGHDPASQQGGRQAD